MIRYFVLLLSTLLIFSACGTITVDRKELDRRIITHQYQRGTVSASPDYLVRYMGSDDQFHYIHHRVDKKERTYRIRREELFLLGPFPKTNDENSWRVLLRPGQDWPPYEHRFYEDIRVDSVRDTRLDPEAPFLGIPANNPEQTIRVNAPGLSRDP